MTTNRSQNNISSLKKSIYPAFIQAPLENTTTKKLRCILTNSPDKSSTIVNNVKNKNFQKPETLFKNNDPAKNETLQFSVSNLVNSTKIKFPINRMSINIIKHALESSKNSKPETICPNEKNYISISQLTTRRISTCDSLNKETISRPSTKIIESTKSIKLDSQIIRCNSIQIPIIDIKASNNQDPNNRRRTISGNQPVRPITEFLSKSRPISVIQHRETKENNIRSMSILQKKRSISVFDTHREKDIILYGKDSLDNQQLSNLSQHIRGADKDIIHNYEKEILGHQMNRGNELIYNVINSNSFCSFD